MSLRVTFLLLLFANLAFFGWANLVDVTPEPLRSDSISHLPQLKLLREAQTNPPPAAAPPAANSATTAPAGSLAANTGSGSPSVAGAPATVAPLSAAPPSAAPNSGAMPGTQVPQAAGLNSGSRCITVGPFADPARAREAADILRERGFSPRQRTEQGSPQGFWVFVGGFKSATDETSVIQRLERNGIADAKAMPAADGIRRVSVGLFNAREGADRRARVVRRLGLDAQVEARGTEAAQWIDLDLASSAQSLPAEGLLSLEENGSRLEIKECPGATPTPTDSSPGGAGSKDGSPPPARSPSTPNLRPQVPTPLTAEGRPRPG